MEVKSTSRLKERAARVELDREEKPTIAFAFAYAVAQAGAKSGITESEALTLK
jgi:hypothetical protein